MRQLVASVGCVVMLLGGTAGGAAAGTPAAMAPSTTPDAVSSILAPRVSMPARYSDAVEEDLAVLAADRGVSQAEARRRYGWQEQAGRAVTALTEQFPDAVAYSRMEDDSENPRLIVAFRDPVPTGAADRFLNVPVPVVVVANIGYSANEFIETMARAHYEAINSSGTEWGQVGP